MEPTVAELMSGMAPSTERTADAFPEETPVYVSPTVDGERPTCQELGCERPCRKRRNAEGFLDYCSQHNALHAGNQSSRPRSADPAAMQEARNRSAEKLAERVHGWGVMLQAGFIASDDRYCAAVLGQEWPLIAKSAGDLALDFPILANAIEKTDKYGTLAMLIFHITKMGTAMAVHHGWMENDGVVKFLIPPLTPEATASMKRQPPMQQPTQEPLRQEPAYAMPPEPSIV